MQQQWSAVDNYLVTALIPTDPLLSQVLENNQRAGLPAIDVAANQGQFLALLVRMTGARRILEIGTLGGYSTIWMARELPADGELLTLEADAHHAAAMAQDCCDHASDSHMAHQGGCSACGVCHSTLAVSPWMAVPGTGAQHSPQAPPGTRFTSALAAQAIKPPIF